MSTAPRHEYTVEEYLDFERRREGKSEYFAGGIFMMAGASERHVSIVTNLTGTLFGQLKGRPCKVYSSEMRLKVNATGLYTYPDVMVVCGPVQLADDRRDMIENPQVIIEVLSRSTESYDRKEKFEHFKRIESLTDYLLVAQNSRHVEHRVRQPDGSWRPTETADQGVIRLSSIGCELPLDDVYDKVEFPA